MTEFLITPEKIYKLAFQNVGFLRPNKAKNTIQSPPKQSRENECLQGKAPQYKSKRFVRVRDGLGRGKGRIRDSLGWGKGRRAKGWVRDR